jgi:hypothetical protein
MLRVKYKVRRYGILLRRIKRLIFKLIPNLIIDLYYLFNIRISSKKTNRTSLIEFENSSQKKFIVYLASVSYQIDNKWDYFSGNMQFEIIQSLIDQVTPDETEVIIEFWKEQSDLEGILLRYKDNKDVVLIVFLYDSIDPNRYNFTWIDVFKKFNCQKHVVCIYLDLVHPVTQFNAAVLGKIVCKLLCVSIDISPPLYLKKYLTSIGPLPLPFSEGTIKEMLKIDNHPIIHGGLVFHGTLYKNRMNSLNSIKQSGNKVIVNPHLGANGRLASYENFFKSISQSEINLNLSLNSFEKVHQLKSRVFELSLVGRPFVSDGTDLIPRFLVEDTDYIKLDPISSIRQRYTLALQKKLVIGTRVSANHVMIHSRNFWVEILKQVMG